MPSQSSIITTLESTLLWKAFAARANDEQRQMVRELVQKASDRLDLVRDTFPTYTLHNYIHSLNVVERMGDLLSTSADNITALEGAILILSAFLHDIGMVFSEEERQDLSDEPDFEKFLRNYPQADVAVREANAITLDIAEWYCRWVHPKRVHYYLSALEDDETSWGQISFSRPLGFVCESHGQDTEELLQQSSSRLSADFLGEADLLFCAILLRLADILDFDNTRSPDEVYKYLDLLSRRSKRTTVSDIEWRKHLCSGGFRFPDSNNRKEGYELRFPAGPDHPAVEYDVRQFLEVIEVEMSECQSLLRHCSAKWQSFCLPGSINRKDILSKGYKYGEYRFTLEQDQVLNLFMGENLYSDPYAFVRELVQNAIDTTRHRQFYEQSRGELDYQPQPIQISTWYDKDGYQWVRIDDFGMGMNEDLISNYLLKVGRSYYQSAQFKAEILRYKSDKSFVPISRFGIGLLSCFIVGDRIEVSTKRIAESKYDAYGIRLSMVGLQSFFTLYDEREHSNAIGMPNEHSRQEIYRKGEAYGTSIAVRLDPRKDHSQFDLKERLEQYVMCSPVPVHFKGEPIGGDYSQIVCTPWIEEPIEEEFTSKEIRQIEAAIKIKFSSPPKIRILPLNLTQSSPTKDLAGQCILGYIEISDLDQGKFKESDSKKRKVVLEFKRKDTKDLISLNAKFYFKDQEELEKLSRKFGIIAFRIDSVEELRRGFENECETLARSLDAILVEGRNVPSAFGEALYHYSVFSERERERNYLDKLLFLGGSSLFLKSLIQITQSLQDSFVSSLTKEEREKCELIIRQFEDNVSFFLRVFVESGLLEPSLLEQLHDSLRSLLRNGTSDLPNANQQWKQLRARCLQLSEQLSAKFVIEQFSRIRDRLISAFRERNQEAQEDVERIFQEIEVLAETLDSLERFLNLSIREHFYINDWGRYDRRPYRESGNGSLSRRLYDLISFLESNPIPDLNSVQQQDREDPVQQQDYEEYAEWQVYEEDYRRRWERNWQAWEWDLQIFEIESLILNGIQAIPQIISTIEKFGNELRELLEEENQNQSEEELLHRKGQKISEILGYFTDRLPYMRRIHELFNHSSSFFANSETRTNQNFDSYWQEVESEIASLPTLNIDEFLNKATDLRQKAMQLKGEFSEIEGEVEVDLTRVFNRLSLQQKQLLSNVGAHVQAKGSSYSWGQPDKTSWLSHNGILVATRMKNSTFRLTSPFEDAWMVYQISLHDSLRPDVSVSRDELRALPWQIYSNMLLSVFKALETHSIKATYYQDIFGEITGQKNFLLGDVLNDSNVAIDGAWSEVPIIKTNHGGKSLKEIRAELSSNKIFEITDIPGIDRILHSKPTFLECCRASMIQVGLDIRMNVENNKYFVSSSNDPIVGEELRLFPPLFFIPYENSNLLRLKKCPLNSNHPFSRWLIENSIALASNYAGLFESIRTNISLPFDPYSDGEKQLIRSLSIINQALERLRQLNADISPGAELNLKDRDFQRK